MYVCIIEVVCASIFCLSLTCYVISGHAHEKVMRFAVTMGQDMTPEGSWCSSGVNYHKYPTKLEVYMHI